MVMVKLKLITNIINFTKDYSDYLTSEVDSFAGSSN
jgi:hypothetical protein